MSGYVEGHSPWPWDTSKFQKKATEQDNERIGWETRGWGYSRVVVSLTELEKLIADIADRLKEISERLDDISEKMNKKDEGDER
jgi:hypothetical protein